MRLRLNISTCPNDTFMFYAMLHGKVDCGGLTFDTEFADIDQLNHVAIEGYADITKISCGVYPAIKEQYQLLRSGSAIGYSNGPVLVSKYKIYPDEVADLVVAIPGEHTTASLLLQRTLAKPKEMKSYLFSDIAEVVNSSEADAGVLIHEGRFTYSESDLKLVADLGELWHEKFALPVPLGAIVAKRSLGDELCQKVSSVIKSSIEYGQANREECYPFIMKHAQEMDIDIINKHIDTFVNNFSLDMGDEGLRSIETLLDITI